MRTILYSDAIEGPQVMGHPVRRKKSTVHKKSQTPQIFVIDSDFELDRHYRSSEKMMVEANEDIAPIH